MTPSYLVPLALVLAARLEAVGNPNSAGIVRQLATAVTELTAATAQNDPTPDDHDRTRCRHCGTAIEQPATGRPRIYCTDGCRRAAYNAARNARNGSMRW